MKFTLGFLMYLGIFTLGTTVKVSPTLALTFADVQQGKLELSSGGEPIGNGSFFYSKQVISGSFIVDYGMGESLFYKDLPDDLDYDDIIDFYVEDNWRVITNISVTLSEGIKSKTLTQSFTGFNFTSDTPQFFSNILLFRATDNENAPINNEILTISIGDARDPQLLGTNRWFLTDGSTGVGSNYQLSLNSDGNFGGFVSGFSSINSGTWTATPKSKSSPNSDIAPEPLTFLGTLTAIGLGSFFKFKLK